MPLPLLFADASPTAWQVLVGVAAIGMVQTVITKLLDDRADRRKAKAAEAAEARLEAANRERAKVADAKVEAVKTEVKAVTTEVKDMGAAVETVKLQGNSQTRMLLATVVRVSDLLLIADPTPENMAEADEAKARLIEHDETQKKVEAKEAKAAGES